jgi:tripartite-type tricarboxylate transporter receptor subunit TctC
MPIVSKLHDEIVGIVKTPESAKRFEALGLDVIANTPEDFAKQIDAEIDKWARVVKAANLKIE